MLKICTLLLFALITLSARTENHNKATNWTEETLQSMTLNEKIGQLFMIAVYSNKDSDYEAKLEKLIRTHNIGGLIFFQGEPVRQANLTNRLQRSAKYPLMIGLDAEHGIGWRLQTAMEFPKMLINGAITNDSLIYQLGKTIARHCKEIGVHINFAPVVDINNNPRNPVIGMRSFGEDRENVFRKAMMYMEGSHSEDVLAVTKHFPGHGDTDTDSHKALPGIPYPRTRLDSIELYPFKKMIEAGMPAIMIAHLNVTALDPDQVPASISPLIIKKLLREELHFNGLCFTDAMNMKGVTRDLERGEAEVKALIAGNDILLFPADIEQAVNKIKQAIKDSLITEKDIDEKCRKILMAKYKYVLPNIQPIKTTGLWSRINTPSDFTLKQELYKNAITLIRNNNNILPLKNLDTLRIASVNFGAKAINNFQTTLDKYTNVTNFFIDNDLSNEQMAAITKQLSTYNCIIIYNSLTSDKASRNFGFSAKLTNLINNLKEKKLILCHPGIPYGLTNYMNLPLDAVLINYEDHLYARQYAAQAIFGGIAVNGKLPVSINSSYPAGMGLTTPKNRLGYATPEMCGINSAQFNSIDSLCNIAINTQATPGCQVLVAKDGYIIYNKAFGYHTYKKETANHTDNIYDLASITKIAATLPAIMKLYDEKKINLDTPLANYYPVLKETNKKNMTVKEVLTHSAGLKAFVPAFADAIDQKALTGRLFSVVPTKSNTLKLKDKLYINPNYHFKDSTLSNIPRPGYDSLAPGLFISKFYRETPLNSIINSELNPKKEYIYSDLGFIFLQQAVEHIANQPIDEYCKNYFYKKLGACRTDYMAEARLKKDDIIPSCIDNIYRKTEIRGTVHDPLAALLGGVAGNAGLFSTAEDIAKIMELYLNKGTYGDEQFFSSTTTDLFTQKADISPANRRGLGFDKPETQPQKPGPTCPQAPASSFGHTGFTGTIAWCDPENNLIYIFLSNRTYPNEFNTKLSDENIRTKIQTAIYRAIGKGK